MTAAEKPVALAERPSAKEQQILAAASMLFMEQGFGATSMDAIAREASVSKATLYARFAGKEELFGAIINAACRRHSETLDIPDVAHQDLRATLWRIGRGFLDLLLSPHAIAIYRIVIGEGPRFPELGRVFYNAGPRVMLDRLGGFLESAAEGGLLRRGDARAAADQFLCLIKGDAHLRRLLGLAGDVSPAELDAQVDAAVDTFLRAHGP